MTLSSSSHSAPLSLRQRLQQPGLVVAPGVHDMVSLRMADAMGFDALYMTGFGTVASHLGLPDAGLATYTDMVDRVRQMAGMARTPLIADGDTGYGGLLNVAHTVRGYEAAGARAIQLEDQASPKKCGHTPGRRVVPVADMVRKIQVAVDARRSRDFLIIARTDARSAHGLDEALRRAEAYADAGADAILIHSKKSDPAEILEFCRLWDNRKPVVVVPTKYYRVPTAKLREAGVSLVIWANHNLRASIQAMRTLSKTLHEQQTLLEIEHEVAPLEDVFALAGASELEEAEKRYLSDQPQTAAVILAATRGSDLGELTEDRPKCMVNVRGQSILERQLDAMKRNAIASVTVVTGYRSDAVDVQGIRKIENPAYASTGEARSLAAAKEALSGPCIVSFGDVVYRPFFLGLLKDRKEDFVILVDPAGREKAAAGAGGDFVRCSAPFSGGLGGEDDATLTDIRDRLAGADGEWVGLLGLSAAGSRILREELSRMEREGELDTADLAQAMRNLIAQGRSVAVIYVSGNWMNINDLIDLAQARNEM